MSICTDTRSDINPWLLGGLDHLGYQCWDSIRWILSDVRESKRQQSSSSACGEKKEGVGGELRFLCITEKPLLRGGFLVHAAGRTVRTFIRLN